MLAGTDGVYMILFTTLLYLFSFNSFAVSEVAVPKVNLAYWNQDVSILWDNNCYNYSTNRVTNSFAQPGEASGKIYDEMTCKDVLRAASADLGLVPTKAFDTKSKTEDTLIALVVAPGYDFHWYRRDDNRHWSHKPGSTEATVLDQSDALIVDPETADRGFYTDFCGYFKVKNFLLDDSEQNAGYVRIGNMSGLPDSEETQSLRVAPPAPKNSEVEILIYSGRRNPRVPLAAFLQSGSLGSSLQSLAKRLELIGSEVSPLYKPSRLGYNGLLIYDREGMVFPKGTTVHLKGNTVIAYYEGRKRTLLDDDVLVIESLLRASFVEAIR